MGTPSKPGPASSSPTEERWQSGSSGPPPTSACAPWPSTPRTTPTRSPSRRADAAVPLRGRGPAAYLDAEQIVDVAVESGLHRAAPRIRLPQRAGELCCSLCRAGADLRRAVAGTLAALGDKSVARAIARRCGVPILLGTEGATTVDEALAFFDSLGAATR